MTRGKQMSDVLVSETWNDLPDIDEVAKRTEADHAVFAELREVLIRHKAIDRFGVFLLHKHFPMADDEVLVEFCDKASRELLIKPVKASEADRAGTVETSWKLGANEAAMTKCQLRCYVDEDRVHSRVHWP